MFNGCGNTTSDVPTIHPTAIETSDIVVGFKASRPSHLKEMSPATPEDDRTAAAAPKSRNVFAKRKNGMMKATSCRTPKHANCLSIPLWLSLVKALDASTVGMIASARMTRDFDAATYASPNRDSTKFGADNSTATIGAVRQMPILRLVLVRSWHLTVDAGRAMVAKLEAKLPPSKLISRAK